GLQRAEPRQDERASLLRVDLLLGVGALVGHARPPAGRQLLAPVVRPVAVMGGHVDRDAVEPPLRPGAQRVVGGKALISREEHILEDISSIAARDPEPPEPVPDGGVGLSPEEPYKGTLFIQRHRRSGSAVRLSHARSIRSSRTPISKKAID